ncbi:hypothetical protein [Leucothrix arctica]|uniref:Uncharacterized protein n=1 Tax=Leucothrix arctica TaxID=1481894 RepID=A0A317CM98_9GAMM|nr:hypothetical protein [Leucothrix arctica]PWQ99646.1 hypothetical protein DKT75_00820 [Leucothrix arctica]
MNWAVVTLLSFIIVFSEGCFYGLYSGEIYAYGASSFFSLVIFSTVLSAVVSILCCRVLLALTKKPFIVIIGGWIIFFVAGVYSAWSLLWSGYLADFGGTWTTLEIIIGLILGQKHVLPVFVLLSFLGGFLLGKLRVKT